MRRKIRAFFSSPARSFPPLNGNGCWTNSRVHGNRFSSREAASACELLEPHRYPFSMKLVFSLLQWRARLAQEAAHVNMCK